MAFSIVFNQLLETTLINYASKQFNDNVFEGLKAFKILMAKPGFKQLEDGGSLIIIPLDLVANPTPTWMGEWDQFPTVNKDTSLPGQWKWKQMGGSIDISYAELAQNSGEYQVLNLAAHKVDNLKNAMLSTWSTSLFSDGSNFGGREIDGLQAIVSTSNPSIGNYGGIDRTVYPNWQANVDSTTSVLNPTDMEHQYNACSHNIQSPDLIISTQTLYEKYIDLNRDALRFNSNDVANLGFDNVGYKGAIVIWDKLCPTGDMFFLNSQQLRLVVHRDFDFRVHEARTPVRQLAVTQPVSWYGNLVALQCRMQGSLTNRTNA